MLIIDDNWKNNKTLENKIRDIEKETTDFERQLKNKTSKRRMFISLEGFEEEKNKQYHKRGDVLFVYETK